MLYRKRVPIRKSHKWFWQISTWFFVLAALVGGGDTFGSSLPRKHERIVEWTIESQKTYTDPFNDVDIDVIFTKEDKTWRVPTFWRGGNKWTVRFAPPTPGEYTYRFESTDPNNKDLNGHEGRVTVAAYSGKNTLLKHGAFRVSANGRYFEQADGEPFYWFGDTLYTAFSDRLSWSGFKRLIDDRKAKGFTVVETAVMVPHEEQAPSDPGFCNEGGCVWDAGFKQINPKFFDYVDRRVQYLIDAEMAPAIIGAWRQTILPMGVTKLKKHWRYIIARYGAYPIFWIAGGEIYDPPADQRKPGIPYGATIYDLRVPGWTEIMQYVRENDPYRHPLSVHEIDPPFDTPVQDESLKDFELFQAGHRGWASLATEVAQLNMHYARTSVKKPLVVGEIGWETIGGEHYEDFQRAAFWLAMLNGAAGYSYGNAITGESYSTDKPLHRYRHSLLDWEEGMNLPGSYQAGLGAKLLKKHAWQRFEPHPDWITPRGTTLLKSRSEVSGFDIDLIAALVTPNPPSPNELPLGEWQKIKGNFRLPYAAGIPGEVRFIYIPARPSLGFSLPQQLTVLNLEPDVRYQAFFWEPSLGVKFDLGTVQAAPVGELIHKYKFERDKAGWRDVCGGSAHDDGQLVPEGTTLSIVESVKEVDVTVAVDAKSNADATLVLRYKDEDNYLAATYSAKDKTLSIVERQGGWDSLPIGRTEIPDVGSAIRLTAEARGDLAIVAVTDGQRSFTSPIVNVGVVGPGAVGLLHRGGDARQSFDNYEVRRPGVVVRDEHLNRELRDAAGRYRGTIEDAKWDNYGKEKKILLNAYRPERVPFAQDWVLVLHKE